MPSKYSMGKRVEVREKEENSVALLSQQVLCTARIRGREVVFGNAS